MFSARVSDSSASRQSHNARVDSRRETGRHGDLPIAVLADIILLRVINDRADAFCAIGRIVWERDQVVLLQASIVRSLAEPYTHTRPHGAAGQERSEGLHLPGNLAGWGPQSC